MCSYKVLISLFVILQSHFIISVLGECCYFRIVPMCNSDGSWSNNYKSLCYDCTRPTPYCPRDGSCNIFGCNCDGNCRQGHCQKGCLKPTLRNLISTGKTFNETNPEPEMTPETIMQQADQDEDGLLNEVEAFNWLSKKFVDVSKDELVRKINLVDKNNDGYISREEIDG